VLLQDVLRRTVGDAYPYFHPTDPTHELGYVDFSGTAGSMHFLASAPQALGGRGRVRFAIELERNSSGTELVVTTTPELAEGSAKPERKLLLSHVEDVEFAYFGKKRSQREAIWHNAWTGEPTLPQLVRVRVRAASSDVRTWPDLLIAPRLTADVGCVHDPLTKQCRGR
jgi:general secretion pathway protein J